MLMLRPIKTRAGRTPRTPSARVPITFAAPVLAAVGLLLAVGQARADFLTNGNFASNGGTGQLTVNTSLTGWTGGGKEGLFGSQSTPPVFVYSPGTTTQLSTTGANGDAFMGNVKFYSATAAPGGGVVVAADGDPDWAGSLQQTVSGLTVGNQYVLNFNWAGAQQQGFSGATTERWQVDFGTGASQFTSTVNTPSQSFAGWQTGSMTFTATSASQLLKFTARGTPGGLPPWLLLNGVTLNDASPVGAVATPEPSTLLAFAFGAVGIVGHGLRRRRAALAELAA